MCKFLAARTGRVQTGCVIDKSGHDPAGMTFAKKTALYPLTDLDRLYAGAWPTNHICHCRGES